MHRLWSIIIRPILESINSKYIVEVGSDKGENTENILKYCMDNNAHMKAIDPHPNFDVDEFKSLHGDRFEFFCELSLKQLPLLQGYDVILLDGDHNWYTVFNELKIIEKTFENKNFPIVFLHDVDWPYARRDLYYFPESIPPTYRQPYKQLGMYPDHEDLVENGGLNRGLNNSLYENNPKNGVLTAVEDFITESNNEYSFVNISLFHGLGILYQKNMEMDNILEECIKPYNLLKNLEGERIKIYIAYSELQKEANRLKLMKDKLTTKHYGCKNQNKALEYKLNQNMAVLESTKNKLNQIEKEKAKIRKIYVELKKDNVELKKDNVELKKDNVELKKDNVELKKDNVELKKDKKLIDDKIYHIEEQKAKIASEYLQLENQNESLEYKLNKGKIVFNRLKNELNVLQEENINLENSYTKIKGYNEILANKLGKVEEEKSNLIDKVNQLQSSSKELISEKEVLIEVITRREIQLKELNSQIDNLSSSFSELKYGYNVGRTITQRLISLFPSIFILFKKNNGMKNAFINIKGYKAIKKHNLLDVGFYLKNYPDVRRSGVDPILHYMYKGFKEGRRPNQTFDSDYYIKTHKDVQNSNINPLVHYSLYGINKKKPKSNKRDEDAI